MVSLRRSSRARAGANLPGGPLGPRRLAAFLGVVIVAGLGVIGYLVLARAGDPAPDGAAPVATRASSSTAGSGSSRSAGTTAGTTAGTGATAGAIAGSGGRNPFGVVTGASPASSTGGAGPATSVTPTTGAPAPATGTATGPAVPPAGTGRPTAVTRTTTKTATATVTTTVSGLYLGLYGWTDEDLPMFLLNETPVTPAEGATVAPSLVYAGRYDAGSSTCASVTYAGSSKIVCEGQVLRLR